MQIENQIDPKNLKLPGSLLGNIQEYNAGEGTFIKNNKIYSAIIGSIVINKNVDEKIQTISVVPEYIKNKSVNLNIGSIILGKVIKIKEDSINVQIMVVDNQPTKQYLEGVIRKQNIRKSEIDKIIIQNTFLPDDIVKAKVISYGDSKKIYLSTADNNLGVVFARNQQSQYLMIPQSWQEFVCPISGQIEYRKVAKPDFSWFQGN